MVMVRALAVAVAQAAPVPLSLLLSDGRCRRGLTRRAARCRQVIGFVIRRKQPATTFKQIGRALGGRDHSTVIHGCDVVRDKLASGDADMLEVYRLVYRCYAQLRRLEPTRREELRTRFEELTNVRTDEPEPVHNPYLDEPFWVTNRARDAQAVS